MHTATLPIQTTARAPVPCALYSAQDDLHDVGAILGLSMHHCHVESQAEVAPGMMLALFVILPGAGRAIVIDQALVTWVRGAEFGLRFDAVRPEDAACVEWYLTQDRRELADAQYPSS